MPVNPVLNILVTGSTGGLGKETATELVKRGHRVMITGRDATRADKARQEMLEQYPQAEIQVWTGDISLMSQAYKLAGHVKNIWGKLDVLINNAGGGEDADFRTTEGLPYTFALNTLAPFVLTHELFPLIEQSAEGRVVHLNSRLHHFALFNEKDIRSERPALTPFMAYPNSKLAQIMWTLAFCRIKSKSHAAILFADPGTAETPGYRFAHDELSGGVTSILNRLNPLYTSTAQAGRIPVIAALNPRFKSQKGLYVTLGGSVHRAKAEAYDTRKQHRVWEECERALQEAANTITTA